jgi:hypothetical protein
MFPYCDVLPLCIMLWAIPHQLEGLSSVGSNVISSNLNLITQPIMFYYTKNQDKIEFILYFITLRTHSFPFKISPTIMLLLSQERFVM